MNKPLVPLPSGDLQNWATRVTHLLRQLFNGEVRLPLFDVEGREMLSRSGVSVYGPQGEPVIRPANVQIDTQHLVDAAITLAKMGKDSIDEEQLRVGAITAQKAIIGDGAILTAMIGEAQILNAQIADAAINNAKINDLSAGKLLAGIISTNGIFIGGPQLELNGANTLIIVRDEQSPAVVRVRIGRLGSGLANYGIEIRDQNGNLILSSGGVNAEMIDALALQNAPAQAGADITGQNTASGIFGQGAFATLSQITGSNSATFIANAAIKNAMIESLYADKIVANSLSAISANLGTITAGIINGISINGSTITGGVVRTGSGSSRVEMAAVDNSLRVFGGDTTRVVMGANPNQGYIFIDAGTGTGLGVETTSGSSVVARTRTGRAVWGYAELGSGIGVLGRNESTGRGVQGESESGIGVFGSGLLGLVGNVATSSQHSIRADLNGSAGDGKMLAAAYDNFTGEHVDLIRRNAEVEPGDLLVDTGQAYHRSILSATVVVERSSRARQAGVTGVFVERFPLSESAPPGVADFGPVGEVDGEPIAPVRLKVRAEHQGLYAHYDTCAHAALGEGLINVCGQGGDVSVGDFLCASDLPGKAMRQDEPQMLTITAAKAREAATFDQPDQVKQIACKFLGG